MQRLVAAVFLIAFAAAASAAEGRRYAVLSLIGDKLELAYAVGVVGAPVDSIEHKWLPLDDTAIDKAALIAVNDQVKSLEHTEPVLLQAWERNLFDVSAGTGAIVEWIRDLTKDKKVTHAILITKLAYNGIPALQKPFVGSGALEGVGFFVGRTPPPSGADPNSAGPGFLSPFAYFRVSLVDLKTGQVVKEERGLASDTIDASNTMTGNAWEALDARQKIEKLQAMVRTELASVMPKLLN
jgi:hypothetical protein